MSMSDPLADMLTRIRNAGLARMEKVELPASSLKKSVAEILEKEGFIKSHRETGEAPKKILELELRYDSDKRMVLRNIDRISKPGRRVYARCDAVPKVKNGLGVCIVSTSQGVMTDREARKRRLGGELLAEIW